MTACSLSWLLAVLALHATRSSADRERNQGPAPLDRPADPSATAAELIGKPIRLNSPGRYGDQLKPGQVGFILRAADRLPKGQTLPFADREFFVHFEGFYGNPIIKGNQIQMTDTESGIELKGNFVRLLRDPVRSEKTKAASEDARAAGLLKTKMLGKVVNFLGPQRDPDTGTQEDAFTVQMLTEPPDLGNSGAPVTLYRHEFAKVEIDEGPQEARTMPHDVLPKGTRVIVHSPLGREDRKAMLQDRLGTVEFFNDKALTYNVMLDEYGKPATLKPEEIKKYEPPPEVVEDFTFGSGKRLRSRGAKLPTRGSKTVRADCNYTSLAAFEDQMNDHLDMIKGKMDDDLGSAVHEAVDKHNEYVHTLWDQHTGIDDLNDSIDKFKDAANSEDEGANGKLHEDIEKGQEEIDLNLDMAKQWKEYNARRMYEMSQDHAMEDLAVRQPRTKGQILAANRKNPRHPEHVRHVQHLIHEDVERPPEVHEFLQSLMEPRSAVSVGPQSQMVRSVT